MEHAPTTTKHRRWNARRVLKWLVLVILIWEVVAWVAARALIVNVPLVSADAIVVLSGSSSYVERTEKAAELYHGGRAPRVLLTNDDTRGGWSSAQQRNPYFVERATGELIKGGVPANKIAVVPGVASGTYNESLLLKDYASTHGLRSVLVVTSAYHSRRALRSLRHSFAGTRTTIGLEAAPAQSTAFWWLQLDGWRDVAGEYVKLVYYRINYG